ncbi:lysophospholipid acyltransferase family protein [Blastococcus sp. SYSU DS0753]
MPPHEPVDVEAPARPERSVTSPLERSPLQTPADHCGWADGPRADAATRRRRSCRLVGALLAAAIRVPLRAGAGGNGRRRSAVCSAAGILTALGVRVEVVNPPRPWPRPRTGHLVVSNHASWLDGLALLVAVRATPVVEAGERDRALVGRLARRLGVVVVEPERPQSVAAAAAEVAARLRRGESVTVRPEGAPSCSGPVLGFRPVFFQAAVDAGAAVCPVSIRYRTATAGPTGRHVCVGGSLGSSIRRVLATRDLVVEVHLLPALEATTHDRRALAAHAIGGAGRPLPSPDGSTPGPARSSSTLGRPGIPVPRRHIPPAA